MYLCLSVRFLDPAFHGRGDGGSPEWPPSPLRLYQALLAVAARWQLHEAAFRWLEAQSPPVIKAPAWRVGAAYRLSVPNNAMDIVARAWCRGNVSGQGDANPATHRTMKTVRPTHLLDGDTVSYLWELPAAPPNELLGNVEYLTAAARHLVALGWGIDLVAGNGRVLTSDQASQIPGESWRPGPGRNMLRVPVDGTLAALTDRHERFLHRVSHDGRDFLPVPPLARFRETGYRRDTDPATRPFTAFQLLTPDAERKRMFDARRAMVPAGMTRHAVAEAARAAGRPEAWVTEFVLGHGPAGPAKGAPDTARFAYLPVPTIDPRGHVGGVRRVLVVEPPGGTGEQATWVRRMSGLELTNAQTHQPEALLTLAPASDPVIRKYVGASPTWSTVTPVVLPGHDDAKEKKTDRLLRRALEQAGLPHSLVQDAELDWRRVGFRPGVDLATRYETPAYLRGYPRYHVRLRWQDSNGRAIDVPGPLAIGAGRYCGLGLLAVEN